MFTHPSKLVMSLKNWQWMTPHGYPSLTAVTYSSWWSHLFLFPIWHPTATSLQWHLWLPQNLYFSIALRQARNSLFSSWFKIFHTRRGQMALVHLGTKFKDNGWTITALPWAGINQAFGKFPPDFMKFIKMVMSLGGFPFFPDWLKFADSLKNYMEEWGGEDQQMDRQPWQLYKPHFFRKLH